MDQLLTAFARAELSALTPTEITDYETLLELPDWDIFSWLVGQAPPPADMENIVARIRKHMDRK